MGGGGSAPLCRHIDEASLDASNQMLEQGGRMFGSIKAHGALLAVALMLGALGGCGQSETMRAGNESAVTRTAPDLAIVTLGVLARGPTAAAAQQAQSQRMAAVVQAARAAGAEEGDVQTVGYSLEPQYAYARGQAPRITGYVSRNTVSVR